MALQLFGRIEMFFTSFARENFIRRIHRALKIFLAVFLHLLYSTHALFMVNYSPELKSDLTNPMAYLPPFIVSFVEFIVANCTSIEVFINFVLPEIHSKSVW